MAMSIDDYYALFLSQRGGGGSDENPFSNVYRGSKFIYPPMVFQDGGSFFGLLGSFIKQHVVPILPSIIKRVAYAGSSLASDLLADQQNSQETGAARVPMASLLKKHSLNALRGSAKDTLSYAQSQLGSGAKRRKKGSGRKPSSNAKQQRKKGRTVTFY